MTSYCVDLTPVYSITVGSCETTFKDCFENHKRSFNHVKHKSDTEFWEIKKCNGTPKIAWKIIRKNMPFLQYKQ